MAQIGAFNHQSIELILLVLSFVIQCLKLLENITLDLSLLTYGYRRAIVFW